MNHRLKLLTVVFNGQVKWFRIVLGCCTCLTHPKHAHGTTPKVTPKHTLHFNSKKTFPDLDVYARKKPRILPRIQLQGGETSYERLFLMSKSSHASSWYGKFNTPCTMSLWFQLLKNIDMSDDVFCVDGFWWIPRGSGAILVDSRHSQVFSEFCQSV